MEYLAIPTKLFESLGEKITEFRRKLMLTLRYGPAARNLGDDAVAPGGGIVNRKTFLPGRKSL